jgi:hypothetical protein
MSILLAVWQVGLSVLAEEPHWSGKADAMDIVSEPIYSGRLTACLG